MQPVLNLTAAASAWPTLADLKARIRVSHSDDDSMLTALRNAAVEFLDGPHGYLGRCIGTQTWTEKLARFPVGDILLNLSPVQTISSVKYYDADGVEQTIDSADYELVSTNHEAVLHSLVGWPSDIDARRLRPVTITAVCGFATVPASLSEAVCQHVATLYEVQAPLGAVGEVLPLAYDDLVRRYKRPTV